MYSNFVFPQLLASNVLVIYACYLRAFKYKSALVYVYACLLDMSISYWPFLHFLIGFVPFILDSCVVFNSKLRIFKLCKRTCVVTPAFKNSREGLWTLLIVNSECKWHLE